MTTDRAELEEALNAFKTLKSVSGSSLYGVRLIAAIEAHLETLPKTKMVEVWRVEYPFKSQRADHSKGWPPDEWRAGADTFASEALARVAAEKWSADKPATEAACIKVTGPHQQEVPA